MGSWVQRSVHGFLPYSYDISHVGCVPASVPLTQFEVYSWISDYCLLSRIWRDTFVLL